MLFYLPLANILSLGFTNTWLSALTTPQNLSVIWFTIWQAGLSAAIALFFGIPGAYVFYHRKSAGKKFFRAFITVPFMLPTIVVAIGFTAFKQLPFFSSFFQWGSGVPVIICANVFMNYSIAVRIIGGVWISIDRSIEDAAGLDGAGRWRTFIHITLPQLRNAIGSAGFLIFLYCAANFGIVLVLGGATTRTIETEIYLTATQYLDMARTSNLVLIQTILTIFAFLAAQGFSRGKVGLLGSNSLEPRNNLDRRDWPVVVLTWAFILGLIVIPIATILIKSFQFNGKYGLQNFSHLTGFGARNVLSISVGQAGLNTLRNGVITTTLSMVVGVIISYLISRPVRIERTRRFQWLMDVIFQIPVGISSVVLGLGYLVTFGDGLLPLRSSWLVTPIAQSLISIPLIVRIVAPALRGFDHELRESAQTDSATTGQIWWSIEVPLIRDALLVAAGYAAIVAVGEFGAANFLAYGDQGTLPTVLYQLISRPGAQNYGMALSASAILLVIALIIVYAIGFLEKER